MVECRQVAFSYGTTTIFSELSFQLEKGQYLVISGPARSGKSTLVRMLAGLLLPAAGEILVDGESVASIASSRKRLRRLRRKIGGVGGIHGLLGDLTILENVVLAAEIADQSPRAARKNALEACGRYYLSQVASRLPGSISEVERRSAMLARAEVGRKNLIVADSPTDGLDDDSARFINDRLAGLRLAGISILYLTSGPGPQAGPDQYLHLRGGGVAP